MKSGPGDDRNLRTLLRSSLSWSQVRSLEDMLVSLSLVIDRGLEERGGEKVDRGLRRLASANSAWLPNQDLWEKSLTDESVLSSSSTLSDIMEQFSLPDTSHLVIQVSL